jgi:hypothetical protein
MWCGPGAQGDSCPTTFRPCRPCGYFVCWHDEGTVTHIHDALRFIVTNTLGLLLTVHVMAASIQDRDGARRLLLWTRLHHPTVRRVWADQGFAGRLVDWAANTLNRMVEIVRKEPGQRGFAGSAQAMGCGAHVRLAHLPPPPGPRLRASHHPCRSHDPLGHDQRVRSISTK